MNAWRNVWTITKRELGAYFTSPLAYVFIVIFLLLCGFFTFFVGGFFERQEASLVRPFFDWHPWFYLFLVPAVSLVSIVVQPSEASILPSSNMSFLTSALSFRL